MPILGQVLMGVLIDTFAWLNSPYIAFTASRLFGIGLVLFGVWIAVVLPHLSGLKRKENANLWLWRAVGILGGTALATQAAVNGEFGRQPGSSLGAATVSFGVGAIGLLLVVLFYEKACRNSASQPKANRFGYGAAAYWAACLSSLAFGSSPKSAQARW